MKTLDLSGDELRSAAFAAIRKELGLDGLIRFLSENFSQPGRDYTEERRRLAGPTVEEISARIASLKAERGGSLAPKGVKVARRTASPAERKAGHLPKRASSGKPKPGSRRAND